MVSSDRLKLEASRHDTRGNPSPPPPTPLSDPGPHPASTPAPATPAAALRTNDLRLMICPRASSLICGKIHVAHRNIRYTKESSMAIGDGDQTRRKFDNLISSGTYERLDGR